MSAGTSEQRDGSGLAPKHLTLELLTATAERTLSGSALVLLTLFSKHNTDLFNSSAGLKRVVIPDSP